MVGGRSGRCGRLQLWERKWHEALKQTNTYQRQTPQNIAHKSMGPHIQAKGVVSTCQMWNVLNCCEGVRFFFLVDAFVSVPITLGDFLELILVEKDPMKMHSCIAIFQSTWDSIWEEYACCLLVVCCVLLCVVFCVCCVFCVCFLLRAVYCVFFVVCYVLCVVCRVLCVLCVLCVFFVACCVLCVFRGISCFVCVVFFVACCVLCVLRGVLCVVCFSLCVVWFVFFVGCGVLCTVCWKTALTNGRTMDENERESFQSQSTTSSAPEYKWSPCDSDSHFSFPSFRRQPLLKGKSFSRRTEHPLYHRL